MRCLELAGTWSCLLGPSPWSLCASAGRSAGSCPAPPLPAACANGWKMAFAAGCVLVPPRWDTGKGAGLAAGLTVCLLRASSALPLPPGASATCPANVSHAAVTLQLRAGLGGSPPFSLPLPLPIQGESFAKGSQEPWLGWSLWCLGACGDVMCPLQSCHLFGVCPASPSSSVIPGRVTVW